MWMEPAYPAVLITHLCDDRRIRPVQVGRALLVMRRKAPFSTVSREHDGLQRAGPRTHQRTQGVFLRACGEWRQKLSVYSRHRSQASVPVWRSG